jgi:hypothetical protein
LAAALRAIPELFSGRYPVGFDTLQGYIPSILALPDNTPMKLFGWAYSPLAIYILWSIQAITKIDVYLLLKIMGPVFYGLLSASFYYLLRRGLGWKSNLSFLVALLFLLQPVILRTGWDQFREELALVFFFVLLTFTKCNLVNNTRNKTYFVTIFSILIILAHQLIAVLLFVVLIWQLIESMVKNERHILMKTSAFIPSALIFFWQLYSQFINPTWSIHFMPLNLPNGTGTFVFTNYFLNDPRFLNGNYFTILLHVTSLALFTILPLAPFAIKGFFKDKTFAPMSAWLLIASFSIIIYPKFALSQYWWWILLIPIPLTIYLGNYLQKINIFEDKRQFRKAIAGLVILIVISLAYASSIIPIGTPYSLTYSPKGLVESSIQFKEIPDAEKAFRWINENLPANSILLVPEKLQGTAYITTRPDIQIRVTQSELTLEVSIQKANLNAARLYAVYFSKEIGNITNILNPELFGNIGVYEIIRN